MADDARQVTMLAEALTAVLEPAAAIGAGAATLARIVQMTPRVARAFGTLRAQGGAGARARRSRPREFLARLTPIRADLDARRVDVHETCMICSSTSTRRRGLVGCRVRAPTHSVGDQ
jgi:hypothetical protein